MVDDRNGELDLSGLLAGMEAASPVEVIDVLAAELATMIGASEVRFLITNLSGRSMVRFSRTDEDAETVALQGTVFEQVLRTQEAAVREHRYGHTLVAPVTHRGDTLGVLELLLAQRPPERTVAAAVAAGHALAYAITVNRRYTDLFEWGQRTTPLSLAAEIQHRLLPDSFTCEAARATVAGWLEPASTVGGDTFDYALDRDVLHLSITDAVGHDVDSALLATVLVGGLRNSRRRGASLATQARDANDGLAAHSRSGRFVTGQVARLDLTTGVAAIVNAGHPYPLRLRNGQIEAIQLAVDLPFGIRPGRDFRVQELPLEPGDRVVFVTDGMLERNAARYDVAEALVRSADQHPREVVRALGAAILEATGGALRDDATILCLDWHGCSARRQAVGGAGSDIASD